MIFHSRKGRSRRDYRGQLLAASLLLLTAPLLHLKSFVVHAALACENTATCEESFHKGSECIDGYCTNPFYKGGCLERLLPNWKGKRVCNSEDPPDAVEWGHCKKPNEGLEYMEVRIHSQNWESAFFESWVVQIILSEILNVPVTIETGSADAKLNFYDPQSPFDFGTSNDWESLQLASTYGDCQDVPATGGYRACAHVIPEVWNGQLKRVRELSNDGIVELPLALGALGHQSWFIPRFTAERDPTILSFLGLQGDGHREKLAKMFLRPTTWGYFCDFISEDNCETESNVAIRAPVGETERERMFVENVYIGHFRETAKNKCDLNPTNCTGHIADYPCRWSSYVQPQTYHLNIALSSDGKEPGSNGYPYSQLTEIWAAANATKSNVMMHWWTPEALVQTYANTDAEFLRVVLPPASQDCIESRIAVEDRCDTDLLVQVGKAEGACDEAPHALQKVLSTGLYRSIYEASIPEAKRSPAYESIVLFQVNSYQIGKFFDYWLSRGTDMWNFDPRDATCQWVIENLDFLQDFVPETHPRILQEQEREGGLFYASISLAGVSLSMIAYASIITYQFRNCRALRYAQVEFLMLLLVGLLMVCIGSIISIFPPTDGFCVSVVWLINLGYTLELVPLIVKVAALNRLMSAARHARRVEVTRKSLFRCVILLSAVIVVFLSLWTGLDPPLKETEYDLTEKITDNGETVVSINYYCASKSNIWTYVAVGWNTLYLIIATVLAFQTRTMQKDFNESRTLSIMIYSHFIFVALRVATVFLERNLMESELVMTRAMIYSADTIATIIIYFAPKFVAVRSEIVDSVSGRHQNRADLTAEDTFDNPYSRQRFSVVQRMTRDRSGQQNSSQMVNNHTLGDGANHKCKHCGKGRYDMISPDEDNIAQDKPETSEDIPLSEQAKYDSQNDDANESVA